MKKKIISGIFRTVFLSVLFFVASDAFSQEEGVDFSGRWKYNEEKSDPGDGRREITPYELNIVQGENSLIVERTAVNQAGRTITVKEEYTLDGETNVNTGLGGQEARSNLVWSDDSKSLVFRISRRAQGRGQAMQTREIKSTEVWSLSDEGNVLTVEIIRETPRGEVRRRIVYEK